MQTHAISREAARRHRRARPVPWTCALLVIGLAPAMPQTRPPPAATAVEMGEALDPQSLDRYRGGAEVDNKVDIHGDVTDNSADNVVTGANIIDGGAFANSAGISTVIQNSGANVLIQNGTIVNVSFTDPGPP